MYFKHLPPENTRKPETPEKALIYRLPPFSFPRNECFLLSTARLLQFLLHHQNVSELPQWGNSFHTSASLLLSSKSIKSLNQISPFSPTASAFYCSSCPASSHLLLSCLTLSSILHHPNRCRSVITRHTFISGHHRLLSQLL